MFAAHAPGPCRGVRNGSMCSDAGIHVHVRSQMTGVQGVTWRCMRQVWDMASGKQHKLGVCLGQVLAKHLGFRL